MKKHEHVTSAFQGNGSICVVTADHIPRFQLAGTDCLPTPVNCARIDDDGGCRRCKKRYVAALFSHTTLLTIVALSLILTNNVSFRTASALAMTGCVLSVRQGENQILQT